MIVVNLDRRRLRKIVVYVALVATFAILGYILATRVSALSLPTNDYVQYWAAGRLNILRLDPYDPKQMLALERSIGWPLDYPVMPYYPPWVIAIFMPMGLPSYPASRVLWMILSLALLLGCTLWLWRFYGGPRKRNLLAMAAAGTFAPVTLVLVEGQLTPLVLLGLAGFMWFERRQRLLLAGVFIALVAIKPLLLVLVWLALILWVFDRRRWSVLGGAVLAAMAALLVALATNPRVLTQYVYYLGHYRFPAISDTATLAAVLVLLLGADRWWLEWLPLLGGVVWFFFYWRRRRKDWDWSAHLPILLFASLLCAPYAWMHDEVVLLVAVIQAAAWLASYNRRGVINMAIASYLVLNVIALGLLPTLHYNQEWYFWLPLAFLVWYIVVRQYVAKTVPQERSSV